LSTPPTPPSVPAGSTQKQLNAIGQKLRGACSSDADCKGRFRTCTAGACVACGGPGQECCPGARSCRRYGKRKGSLACVPTEGFKAGACTPPDSA
jgi:hypothetical protein